MLRPGDLCLKLALLSAVCCSLVVPATADAAPPGTLLGGLDLATYCQSAGFTGTPSVVLAKGQIGGSGDAYDNWACVRNDGTRTLLPPSGPAPSLTAACEAQYPGRDAVAETSSGNNAYAWQCYTLAAATTTGSQGTATPDLIANGGFEEPQIGIPYGTAGVQFPSIPAWSVTGSVDLISRSYWQPGAGNQSLDLEGTGTGSVAQTVTTTSGTHYVLRWEMAGNPVCQTAVRILNVAWNGRLIDAPTFDTTGHTNNDLGWVTLSLSVQATGTRSTVQFTEATPNHSNCGVTLDNVSLTAAPAASVTTGTGATTTTTPTTAVTTTPSQPGAAPAKGGAAPRPRRSTITSTLVTPSQAFSSTTRTLINVAITIAALLFITFPAQLFNHTFEENYEEIASFWERRLRPIGRLRRTAQRRKARWRGGAAVVSVMLLGGLLGGLLDPRFGINGSSAVTYLSTTLFTIWGIAVSTAVVYAYRRVRSRDLEWRLTALPAGLAIAAFCVLVSRLSSFEPGYLYGVVCWAAFSKELEDDEKGHTVALSILATVVLAFLAWLLWVPVNHHSGGSANWLLVLVDDFLGAAFTGALIGALIGLIPLDFLPGGTIARWHRGAWAAVFALVTFSFVEIVLDPGSGHTHTGHGALATIIVLFVLFGGGSVAFAGYFARKHRRAEEAETVPEPAVPEGARHPTEEPPVDPSTLPPASPPDDADERTASPPPG